MVFYCAVPSCGTNAAKMSHRLPRDEDLAREWLRRINNSKYPAEIVDLESLGKKVRICHRHFSEQCLIPPQYKSRRGIKERSIPTLFLPSNVQLTLENTIHVKVEGQLLTESNLSAKSRPTPIDEECTASTSGADAVQIQPDQSCKSPRKVESEVFAERNVSAKHYSTPEVEECITSTFDPVAVQLQSVQSCKSPKTRKDLHHRKRYSFAHCLGINGAVDIAPTARKLYRIVTGLRKTAKRLSEEKATASTRIAVAQELFTADNIFKAKLNLSTTNTLLRQLRRQSLRPKRGTFTVEEKFRALSLMMQNPRGYRLLESLFALPSRKSLLNVLANISFQCGINKHVMSKLKKTVSKMDKDDKLCVLLFDEMTLEPDLHYSGNSDRIVGFEDLGDGTRRCKFADRASVFMARGVSNKWKQPICCYFSDSGFTAARLKVLIPDVIKSLQSIGLIVVATVCDQRTANAVACDLLKAEAFAECLRGGVRNPHPGSFFVGGQEIVALFDPPRLLIALRNHLLQRDARFELDGGTRYTASWKFVQELYENDAVRPRDLRLVPRLTEAHVYRHKLKWKEVSVAAQVFSQKTAAIMHSFAENQCGSLLSGACGTARFLVFADSLFDSVNGSSSTPVYGEKKLRRAITAKSAHQRFWNRATKILDTVEFRTSKGKWLVPPTARNWKATISGLRHLWKTVSSKHHMSNLMLRRFNQDSVRNFLASIRSHGVRKANPTCWSFVSTFKTLLANDFVSASHSLASECVRNDFEGALDTLKDIPATSDGANGAAPLHDLAPSLNLECSLPAEVTEADKYVAGYFAKRLLSRITCDLCRKDLITDVEDDITYYRYQSDLLVCSSSKFLKTFVDCYAILNRAIPQICAVARLKRRLKTILTEKLTFTFSCPQHELLNDFLEILVAFFIRNWVKNVNDILKGTVVYGNAADLDDVQKMAHVKYKQIKTNKVKTVKSRRRI